jgi:oligopeptide/dipeptide ABC transporter ATP-binding protein
LPRLDQNAEGKRLYRIRGQPPSLIHVPSGCPFHPRCDYAHLPEPCATLVPELRAIDELDHVAACHFAEAVAGTRPDDVRPTAAPTMPT